MLPSEQELAASALRYSQLTEAFAVLHDLTGYLALYCKYPAVEYLWKMGFGRWLQEREPDAEQMAFFRKTVQSGLRPAELMAAIDYAVSVVGFEGVARDYWPHVQAEARRIWREMRAAGFLDRQENPSP